MRRFQAVWGFVLLAVAVIAIPRAFAEMGSSAGESTISDDERMAWWREARFGMFIHWGLYVVPAGEWKGTTNHAEWIRTTAQIPIHEYDRFVDQFNPVRFDADEWARMAKHAGMKYIVITSKHHDGFCLFNSEYTDFDIMSTPFKRDIMKELADACRRHGLTVCWYHSIMDWHHPDYIPRREWEDRSAEGAVPERYVKYMKSQLKELVTNYGDIGVLWFDGEWENFWNHEQGEDLYNYVRSLQPSILINNRVDVGRGGMAGMHDRDKYVGDFGTPEQEIPATGLAGYDWETCMTMNDHWGYNKNDSNWKSNEDLIRKLADIASKGGNFLLNIGPMADGRFPRPSIERLAAMGGWMEVNGEAIHGTQASPFERLPWGRCTQKSLDDGVTRLYLHVFDWPSDGTLVVSGLFNDAQSAHLLTASGKKTLTVTRSEDALVIGLPAQAPDPIDSVVVLDIKGKPDVAVPPDITASATLFVDTLRVTIASGQEDVDLRYTTDGSNPGADASIAGGPVHLKDTTTVKVRSYRGDEPMSGVVEKTFTKVKPRPAVKLESVVQGLKYEYYEGEWDRLPDFDSLTSVKTGTINEFSLSPRNTDERFAFRYTGFIKVPRDGAYHFSLSSDDGSRLYIGAELVVDNDGLHAVEVRQGVVALAAGLHPITATFFEKTGGDDLDVSYSGPGIEEQPIPADALWRVK